MWPDWAIYCTLGSLSKHIFCPNCPHFLAIFVKMSKSFIFYWNHFWATFIDIWQLFTGHTACEHADQCAMIYLKRLFSDGGGVTYDEGSILPAECGSFDLKPAIEFKNGQNIKTKKEFEKFFIDRVSKFACACINQRCNGTIFFGVGDNKVTSGQSYKGCVIVNYGRRVLI